MNSKQASRLKTCADMVRVYLQGTKGLPEQKRVLKLIRAIEELHRVVPSALKRITPGVYWIGHSQRVRRLREEIERILRRYPVSRVVDTTLIVRPGERPLAEINTISKAGVLPPRNRNAGFFEQPGITEHHAVDLVVELANSGSLRVRQCANADCQRWFVATRKNSVTCSPKCLYAVYSARGYFAEKMRANRKTMKEKQKRKDQRNKKGH